MSKVNVDNLKHLINNFIENRQFAKVSAGTITSINPLKISLENNIELTSELVTITWADQLGPESLNQKIFLIRQDTGGHYYALPKFTSAQLGRLNSDGLANLGSTNGYGNYGTVTSSNAWLKDSQMEENAQFIWTWLKDNGWSEQAAAGFLGNTHVESSHNPGIYENLDEGNMQRGFGLVQWTPASIFHNWAKENKLDPTDIKAQLTSINGDTLRHWIKTDEFPLSYQDFKTSTDSPTNLARAFMLNFERPANQVQPKRGEWAEYYYARYKGKVFRPSSGGLVQPKASTFDTSKATRATSVSTVGWNLEEVNRFTMNSADPPHVTGTYIDNFLKSYYSDSPLIGQGETIKRWSDYYGISVGAALGVWAKETTFGRGHPGKVDHNYGCMTADTAPQYPKVYYGDRYWVKFPSKTVGIGEWFKYVRYRYIEQGLSSYEAFLNVYSPAFENNQASFKNIMWGLLKAFGYDTSDSVVKTNLSKQTDDVQTLNIHQIANPTDYQTDARVEKILQWFEAKLGKVTYSMANRTGPNSYDCSSAVFYALTHAGFLPPGTWPGTTETLFGYEGTRLIRINRNEIRRGDIFVTGIPGQSSGAAGHTGVVYDSNRIIHCTYSKNGIVITPIAGYTSSNTRWYRLAGTGASANTPAISNIEAAKLEEAISIATAQVGKSYVLGAVGPNSFDCSGLVYYAYRAAGFKINHRCTTYTMNANQAPFKTISRSELKRGDLIMYPGHVGIYLGPTLSSPKSLVHAATPSLGVIYQRADSMQITGYRRVTG